MQIPANQKEADTNPSVPPFSPRRTHSLAHSPLSHPTHSSSLFLVSVDVEGLPSFTASPPERKCHSVLQFLIVEYDSLFVQMYKNFKVAVRDGCLVIQTSRLQGLVDKLVDENYRGILIFLLPFSLNSFAEVGYGDIIFLTHSYYTTSSELLKRLIKIYPLTLFTLPPHTTLFEPSPFL